MTRFFLKLFFLILLVLISSIVVYLLPDVHVLYLSASLDKHSRLNNTPPPRVIFVGGSNIAFGVDSQLVEKRLGRSAVNMGLAADVGLRFMLDEIKPSLSPGDVVVVTPEYEQLSSLLNGGRGLSDLVAIAPENLRYLSSPRQYVVLLENLPLYQQDKIYRWLVTAMHGAPPRSDIYRRDGFNHHGDLTTHLGRPPTTDWQEEFTKKTFKPEISSEAIAVLNGFNDYAKSKGAQVVFIFPAIPDSLDAEGTNNINGLYRRLQTETNLTISSPPENYFYPMACFFDSNYHLNQKCREIRTQQILTDLTLTQK